MSLGREEAVFFGILWRFFPSQCYQGALYARSIFNGALFVAQKDTDRVVKVSILKTSHTGNRLQHCAVRSFFSELEIINLPTISFKVQSGCKSLGSRKLPLGIHREEAKQKGPFLHFQAKICFFKRKLTELLYSMIAKIR